MIYGREHAKVLVSNNILHDLACSCPPKNHIESKYWNLPTCDKFALTWFGERQNFRQMKCSQAYIKQNYVFG